MTRIIIVGGGISGLTVAYYLRGHPELDVTVLEAESRPGGKIWSEQVDGFLCERGPNGFLDNRPRTLQLCEGLGITPLRANDNAKKRYILSGNILKSLPESPPTFFRSDILSIWGRLRLLYEPFAPKGPDDETVAEFVVRRLGREALEMLIDPMVSGIYAGDPYRLSIKSCFPRIKELEEEYGSLIKALIKIRKKKGNVSVAPGGRLTSFVTGAQTLTDTLAETIGSCLKTGVRVNGIEDGNGLYHLYTSEGVFDAEIVVFACPAYESARVFNGFDDEIARELLGIKYPPVTVVCFGYKKERVGYPLNGFGFLIPHKEDKRILGTLWDSSIFPNRAPEGYVLLRTMVGGARLSEIAMLDDDRVIGTVFDELKPILGLKGMPDMVRIYRWERAIPQYEMGHNGRLRRIGERLRLYNGIYLTGNAYRGIGMNDCIEDGFRVAEDILSVKG
ncbi:MAG: protoporphyrinogen oxidase [Thermodesulfovibrionia bacterium]